jgi:very-short-patch-repair endonuclease
MKLSQGQRHLKQLLGSRWKFEYRIPWTRYIADLAHPSRRILIEVDGPYHRELNVRRYDTQRDHDLRLLGWRTIRITEARARLCNSDTFPMVELPRVPAPAGLPRKGSGKARFGPRRAFRRV